MAVVFESVIKSDGDKSWVIEIKDLSDGRVEVCKNLEEYEEKIEQMGQDYGGHIDEVRWIAEEGLPPHFLDEVRFEMAKMQDKYGINSDDKVT
jgi:hypothetical protein